jgi:hypothetical protein
MGPLQLSRADRLLLGIVLVTAVLVALVTWLVLPPEKTGGMEKQPSTFFNVAYGTKAAYLVLERLEFPVTRLRRPIERETLGEIGVLFVLEPEIGLRDREVTVLESWVKEGHALVVVPGSSVTLPRLGSFLGQWFHFAEAESSDEEMTRASVRNDQPVSDRELDSGESLLAGIRQLTTGRGRRFSRDGPLSGPLAGLHASAFWKDKLGIVGLRVKFGEGTVIALADAHPLSNVGISEADNGLLLGNVVRELSEHYPGCVAFDEYHLGFPQRDWSPVAMAKLIVTGQWRWAVGQALVAGLLALYAAAVRFGRPRDVARAPRRQHREFAEAAGRLLDEAGAASLAAETLYRYYRDRLCRLVHLEPEADDRRLSQAVRDRSGQELGAILQQARGAASGPVSRQGLLTLTQKLHLVVEALDHGP